MSLKAMSAAAYARMLKALLPPGQLRLDEDAVLSGAVEGAAEELARISQRAADLLEESDPRTATELLPDYERVLKLPSTGTLEERRARVVSWLLRRQRVRPADYRKVLAPILGQDEADVVVIEISRADAIAMDDDRAIYNFYIYRDPDLPGSYDVEAAQELVDSMSHSHTRGRVIESTSFKCDDPHSLCDRDLLGV